LEVAQFFLRWLRDPHRTAAEGQTLTTLESWPTWDRFTRAPSQDELQMVRYLSLFSQQVRYPADGMAYVFCPITHADQDEGFVFTEQSLAWVNVVTLLLRAGEWKVHQVGEMLDPSAVGLKAYSW
jgi:hypothetical protein